MDRERLERARIVLKYATDEVKRLEVKVNKTEKPGLRQGDIRFWEDTGNIGMIDKFGPTLRIIWAGGCLRTCGKESDILSHSKPVGTLKRVFDDLAATQEDLTEVVWEYEIDKYRMNIDKDGALRIRPTDCHAVWVRPEELPAFIQSLRRLYITHLRKKAK